MRFPTFTNLKNFFSFRNTIHISNHVTRSVVIFNRESAIYLKSRYADVKNKSCFNMNKRHRKI